MISRSEWLVAESIRRRVIAEGGYMFHERRADGSWLHGFERRDSDGKITRKFSEALMADVRRNRVALRKLGEWMCRDPQPPPGGRYFRRPSEGGGTSQQGPVVPDCNAKTRL